MVQQIYMKQENGLSCKAYIDIIGVLLCDYSKGIIDNAKLVEK